MRLRSVQRSVQRGPVHGLFGRETFPGGAILHWDADIDAFSEQTGGVHTFNHAVLSPQYQLGADGSYSDVGAKPAVDTFDGEKWLRSCGAVENLLPEWWPSANTHVQVSSVNGYTKLTKLTTNSSANIVVRDLPSGNTYTATLRVRAGDGTTGNRIDFGFHYSEFKPIAVTGFSGPGSYTITSDPVVRVTGLSTEEDTLISVTLTQVQAIAVNMFFYPCGIYSTELGASVLIKDYILTATAYPVPYVPPGVTQPASHATTTNGSWFALPDGSPLWHALTGQPLTLATRVRMGVGSGDLIGNTSTQRILTPSIDENVLYYRGDYVETNSKLPAATNNNKTWSEKSRTWPRGQVVNMVLQVFSDGTQWRAGSYLDGAPSIEWHPTRVYDGSFNPSTLYRLMLGYNNAYPMWFNKITAWKKQVTDAEILEAMA